MSNDITTLYTREQNQKTGRKGYGYWKQENVSAISPAQYGAFVTARRKQRGRRK